MYNRLSIYLPFFLCVSSLIAQANELSTAEQYEAKFTSDTPMITMYTSPKCGPCKSTKPHFISLAASNSDINFCLVDTTNDAFGDILNGWGITHIPYFIFSYKGQKVLEVSGGMKLSQLESYLNQFRDSVDSLKNAAKKTDKKAAEKKSSEPKKAEGKKEKPQQLAAQSNTPASKKKQKTS